MTAETAPPECAMVHDETVVLGGLLILLIALEAHGADPAAQYFTHYARELVHGIRTALVERDLTTVERARKVRSGEVTRL